MTKLARRLSWITLIALMATTWATPSRAASRDSSGATKAASKHHRKHRARTRLVRLHGTMHVRNLVLRKRSRYLVTRSLTIIARGSVAIDAPVRLAPGAGLTILAAGGILNKAPIGPQAGRKAAAVRAASDGCPDTPPIIEVSHVLGIDVEAPIKGVPGGTAPDGRGCPGQSVYLAAFSSALTEAAVQAGLQTTFAQYTLRAAILRALKLPTHKVTSGRGKGILTLLLTLPSGNIRVKANIDGGSGGRGGVSEELPGDLPVWCRDLPTTTSTPSLPVAGHTFVRGGDGGGGGDVTLFTANLGLLGGGISTGNPTPDESELKLVDRAYVRPGNGGRGGSVGSALGPIAAKPGRLGREGGSVDAISGSGGHGGLSHLFARFKFKSDQEAYRAGEGGGPGDAFVHAGNGGASSCSGGDAFVEIGNPGQNALIPGNGRPQSPAPERATVSVSGGNASPGPAAGEHFNYNGRPRHYGGDGGNVVVFQRPLTDPRTALLPTGFQQARRHPDIAHNPHTGQGAYWDPATQEWIDPETGKPLSRSGREPYAKLAGITVTDAGNGGAAFNGCHTGTAGGRGGQGGALQINGGLGAISGSFNGGHGGDGVGPGGPGPPGSRGKLSTAPVQAELIKDSFVPGPSGKTCPGATPGSPPPGDNGLPEEDDQTAWQQANGDFHICVYVNGPVAQTGYVHLYGTEPKPAGLDQTQNFTLDANGRTMLVFTEGATTSFNYDVARRRATGLYSVKTRSGRVFPDNAGVVAQGSQFQQTRCT